MEITHEQYLASNKVVNDYLKQMESEIRKFKRDTNPKSDITIDDIKISSRLYHLLSGRLNVKYVHQLGDRSRREYSCYRGVGIGVLREIKGIMVKYHIPFEEKQWKEVVIDEE
jgi:DNA-directed RNA polymerase alpha subunit